MSINTRVFSYFNVTPDSPEWLDWKWQFKHRITDADTLSRLVALDSGEISGIRQSLDNFKMALTPYFASIMDPGDACCPIRMQSVPSAYEMGVLPWEAKDPLDEEHDSPVENIIHRYPDRAVFLVARQCAMYCRHCVRKAHMGEEGFALSSDDMAKAIGYIANTPQIRDVLVSGGDPLMLDDAHLESVIAGLRAIEHVEIIRIGTRAPSALPMRITPALLAMLKKYHPIWINTQFNHPAELTREALQACADIVDAGIPLGNQSVLLKGVNDDTETMKALLLGLVKARVRPYYLYQCDLCEGAGHFRTKVEAGIEIIRQLTGAISGFAIPKLVIDVPGGGGKVPIGPDYIESIDDEKIVLRNYQGKQYSYHQP
ncbi:MAG: KamA family radical SAM protein [Oscillospiraceae bacterium]|nr:KamA family radical SAM protein [Oscillospiraceae bacterium]